jgi:hypothetical protein
MPANGSRVGTLGHHLLDSPRLPINRMGADTCERRRFPRVRTSVTGTVGERSSDWIKIKNIAHPAIERTMLIALSKRNAACRRQC